MAKKKEKHVAKETAGMPFRTVPAPWSMWGEALIDQAAQEQMQAACLLPHAVQGALLPDAHVGYGLPIGGVLAVRDVVIPYAVGVDIACRMRLTVLDMPVDELVRQQARCVRIVEEETRFGLGAMFTGREQRDHAVMHADWQSIPVLRTLQGKAAQQLGTSGGGNHFVELGVLLVETHALGVTPGSYTALLSHSGSRGAGEAVALHYSKIAMAQNPKLPQPFKHLAWLQRESAEGAEYWAAMQLMGAYSAANHELIHAHISRALGCTPLGMVENHHNFAWEETHGQQRVVVHRKGATPAHAGVLGIVPGSMASPAFIVRGKGNEEALCSCSHGAGRVLSRTAALKSLSPGAMQAALDHAGVHMISGGCDEAPMAYKSIEAVMAAQHSLVDVLGRFMPRLVKMAPAQGWRHRR